MEGWNLSSWIESLPNIARESRDRWPEHAAFFEATVQGLLDAPFAPPPSLLQREIYGSAATADAERGLAPVDPESPEWAARHWPTGELPQADAHAHLVCMQHACLGVVRSLSRSGFFAIAGLVTEALGAHRRTIEGLVHVELLIDDASLARPWWKHAKEHTRKERKSNAFYKAAEVAQSQIRNPKHHQAKHTPLRRALASDSDSGFLNAGPHAGLIHGALGFCGPGPFSFFDRISPNGALQAFSLAVRTLRLAALLVPKLPWVRAEAWAEFHRSSEETAVHLQQQMPAVAGKSTSPNHNSPLLDAIAAQIARQSH